MFSRLSIVVLAGLLAPAMFGNAQQSKQVNVNLVPVKTTPASSGQEMYSQYCAACHGTEGRGNGPAAKGLKVHPTNLTMLAATNNGKFPANTVVTVLRYGAEFPEHVRKEMPVWGPVFRSMSTSNTTSEEQQRISNITRYLDTLQVR
jgi:mono/diheme cytochrome c family protein